MSYVSVHKEELYIERQFCPPPIECVLCTPVVIVYETRMAVTDVLVYVTQTVNLGNVQHKGACVRRDIGRRQHLPGEGGLVWWEEGSARETEVKTH